MRTVNVIPGKREHRSLSVPWRMKTVFDSITCKIDVMKTVLKILHKTDSGFEKRSYRFSQCLNSFL